MKQVKWTKNIIIAFEEEALLSEDECYIMESRCKNVSVSAQAQHLNISESTVARMISRLKKKYDAVQKEHPDKFPPRKYSAQETWMDNN